ncbi:MAG: T9SS type A sorting domain-containing protein [Bacteroidetes bacterium]|nr:T9SS type A sorting domain-containing protein [Bacteroidota bacterium]
MKKIILLFLILASATNIFSQDKQIMVGQWLSHLDYSNGTCTAEVGDTIYVGTATGVFYYIKAYHAAYPLSRKNGLAEVQVRKMKYSAKYDQLFIAYESSNIDVMQNHKVYNIPDIMNAKSILGVKQINNFDFYDKYCFISTTFGIVKYDMEKKEVAETFTDIGPDGTSFAGSQLMISDIAFSKDSIYAATNKGLISAPFSKIEYWADYRNWHLSSAVTCSVADSFANKLWVGFKGQSLKYFDGKTWTIYSEPGKSSPSRFITYLDVAHNKMAVTTDSSIAVISPDLTKFVYNIGSVNNAIIDREDYIWAGVNLYGVLLAIKDGYQAFIKPNGPWSAKNAKMAWYKDETWITSGGFDLHIDPYYCNDGVSIFSNGTWTSKNFFTKHLPLFQDVYDIAIDPRNGHKWLSSFGYGILEFDNNQVLNIYNRTNSGLRAYQCDSCKSPIKVAGLSFDKDNNLWIANSFSTTPIVVRDTKGKFYAYNAGSGKDVIQIATDDFNQIWGTRPFTGGVVVYNHKGTLADMNDDKVKEFNTGKGFGNLPDRVANCVVKDKEGQIWIGTNSGVAVVYDPSSVFINKNFDAQLPWVENGKESGYLLAAQLVNCIAVDGGNRKWIGTKKGVWVTNPDGTKILNYFTTKNSPLPTDNVKNIGINGQTGEVFMGTDLGVVSYMTNATEPTEEFGDVYAYPNPVKPDYDGDIYIKGLITKTNVKITDITGNIVYETTSQGGTATWNGRDFSGRKANSGVYLVFLANDDGSKSMVTKILIVRN